MIIFDTSGAEFTSALFYLEPVETGTADVDAAVTRIVDNEYQP